MSIDRAAAREFGETWHKHGAVETGGTLIALCNELDAKDREIAELTRDRDHWREAQKTAQAKGELLVTEIERLRRLLKHAHARRAGPCPVDVFEGKECANCAAIRKECDRD